MPARERADSAELYDMVDGVTPSDGIFSRSVRESFQRPDLPAAV